MKIPEYSSWKEDIEIKNYYSLNMKLWGQRIEVGLNLSQILIDLTSSDYRNIENEVSFFLNWINEKKDIIREVISSEDNINLANEWISSAESFEGNENRFVMEDDEVVEYPIEKDIFQNSLRLNSVGIDFDQSGKLRCIKLYVECYPDYFAGHAIEVEIFPDHNIKVGSLVG